MKIGCLIWHPDPQRIIMTFIKLNIEPRIEIALVFSIVSHVECFKAGLEHVQRDDEDSMHLTCSWVYAERHLCQGELIPIELVVRVESAIVVYLRPRIFDHDNLGLSAIFERQFETGQN